MGAMCIVYSTMDLGQRLHWIYWLPGETIASLDGRFEVKWTISCHVQIVQRSAEMAQSAQHGLSVLSGRHDPDVHVHGGPRIPVSGHGIGADEEVSNLFA